MEVNWTQIKKTWENGSDLSSACAQYKVTTPEIALKAASEGWGERGAKLPYKACNVANIDFDTPILDEKQVSLAHKTDLGRLRLVAACILESMQGESSLDKLLKTTERLIKVYAQLIPLERKVFGMDENTDDSPDAIIISRVRRSVASNEAPK